MAEQEGDRVADLVRFVQNIASCPIYPDGRPIECSGLVEDKAGNFASAACVSVCMVRTLNSPKSDPNQFSLFDGPGFAALQGEST